MRQLFCTIIFLCATFWLNISVHARDIYLGMSGAFTGPTRSLGIELYRGSKAYFDFINDQGGVNGNKIYIKGYDDGYNPNPALINTINLVEKDKVFLLFDYVGTPTTTRILPLLQKYSSKHIYLFCPFTGANPMRQPPYNKFVYNLRASYDQEVTALVDNFVALGIKKFGVFYQIDAYGRGGWQGIRKALHKYGLEVEAEATYSRGAKFTDSFVEQVNSFLEKDVDAVICISAYAAAAGFIRDARDLGLDVPIANISFVDAESQSELLFELEQKTGKNYTQKLVNSQVVPFYTKKNLPALKEYKMCMEKYRPTIPKEFDDGSYNCKKFGAVSFEGFLNAKLVVKLLEALGSEPVRAEIPEAMCRLNMIDLGIDSIVFYTYYFQQPIDKVYFITFQNGQIKPLKSFKELLK
ncbi:ABC transporter substrate-binding protein [Desulfohalobiaceae bacterium Ax17]|uniref:ABC transporter substrate-binding protein n=1 Tax=Desulfovulcanus ferrireducens TaxID=2831190 RepID=UPI00207BCA9B|nr:ABC transporter substrate-binding protein [Desulfovulcanus ferrireducens]MBT8764356.1 ABC transporter substrate-binding protein [Desulfovulcanus ferrireducens]